MPKLSIYAQSIDQSINRTIDGPNRSKKETCMHLCGKPMAGLTELFSKMDYRHRIERLLGLDRD